MKNSLLALNAVLMVILIGLAIFITHTVLEQKRRIDRVEKKFNKSVATIVQKTERFNDSATSHTKALKQKGLSSAKAFQDKFDGLVKKGDKSTTITVEIPMEEERETFAPRFRGLYDRFAG